MQLILDEYRGPQQQELKELHALFVRIIARLEDIYHVRPFNQQTAQSLTELFALVRATRPRTIFELGAGSRSSTIALSLAAARMSDIPSIFSLDVAPTNFRSFARAHFSGLRFAPVHDIAMEATRFRIPDKWERPILMLYDAHDDDLPGIKIFPYARTAWFPRMRGAVIAVHDCSVYPEPQADLAQHYHQAVFSPDVTIVGYGEVPELVAFLRQHSIPLGLPGREMQALGLGSEGTSLVYFRLPEA
jgi:hypothetical protein